METITLTITDDTGIYFVKTTTNMLVNKIIDIKSIFCMISVIITAFYYQGYRQQLDKSSIIADVNRVSSKYRHEDMYDVYVLTDIPQLTTRPITSDKDYIISLSNIISKIQGPLIMYFSGHGVIKHDKFWLTIPWYQYPRVKYISGHSIADIINKNKITELFYILDCCYATGIAKDIIGNIFIPGRAISSCKENQKCGFLSNPPYGSLFTYFWSIIIPHIRTYNDIKTEIDNNISKQTIKTGRSAQNITMVLNNKAVAESQYDIPNYI